LKVTHYKEKPTDEWIEYSCKSVQVNPLPYGPGVFFIRKDKGRLRVCALKWDDGSSWDAYDYGDNDI